MIAIAVLVFVISVMTAVLSALIGIGGGLILVPTLATIGGLTHYQAAGTALAAMVIFSFVATVKNMKNGLVFWKFALAIASGSIFGAYVGARLSFLLPLPLWKMAFILVAVYVGYGMIFNRKANYNRMYLLMNKLPFHIKCTKTERTISLISLFLFGIIVGISSAVLGVGGGFLTTPFFILGMKLDSKSSVATSLLVIFITSLSGSISHIYLSHFSLHFWIITTIGMAIGGYAGAVGLKKIPDRAIRYIFSGTILFSIILTLVK